jgi:diguanylate cyclase (GGDEF)-like protein
VEAGRRKRVDGFIITDAGRYLGVGQVHDLMREITQMQIHAARYANPLTLLPGNVPTTEHMARLLEAREVFCVSHCDLDNFKPYNDVFGYSKGDDIILLTAQVLQSCCDAEYDFLGHIGGDDFILLFQSPDWEARCLRALRNFEQALRVIVPIDDASGRGFFSEDRRGERVFYPFPTLSIGAVLIETGAQPTHLEVSAAAAEAKKQAKRTAGNSLFVERRQPAWSVGARRHGAAEARP